MRAFCREHGIAYQGFSLLTANGRALASPLVARHRQARRHARPRRSCSASPSQVRMIPLTGTSSAAHMREDLACLDFELTAEDVAAIEHVAS